jgi:hypothetical protein
MVRCGDAHRVDLPRLTLEHLAPVLIDADLWKPLLYRLEPGEVHVGHRDELKRRVPRERVDVREGLARRANTRVPDDGLRRGQAPRGPRRNRRRGADGLQESPTRQ